MSPMTDNLTTLHPLTEFYRISGRVAPRVEPIEGGQVPEPYRQLLVHHNDMTPTLEAFCGMMIHLRLLERYITEDALYRQVVLIANGDGTPMEFGAIKIHLPRFDPEPRRLILECHRPLGTILHQFKIAHHSKPSCYFRIQPDPSIAAALGLGDSPALYGRHNTIYDAADRTLAEVVEILPPFVDTLRSGEKS